MPDSNSIAPLTTPVPDRLAMTIIGGFSICLGVYGGFMTTWFYLYGKSDIIFEGLHMYMLPLYHFYLDEWTQYLLFLLGGIMCFTKPQKAIYVYHLALFHLVILHSFTFWDQYIGLNLQLETFLWAVIAGAGLYLIVRPEICALFGSKKIWTWKLALILIPVSFVPRIILQILIELLWLPIEYDSLFY